MAGRKTKLTPEVQAKIVQALGVGTTREHACQYAGIGHTAFHLWLQKAEAGKSPYAEFAEAIKNAEGQAVVGWMALIDSAARGGNWQAAAWKLERRYSKDYGRRVVEHTGPGGGPIQHVIRGDLGSGDGDYLQISEAQAGTNGAVQGHEAL